MDLLTISLWRAIVRFALPYMFAYLLQVLYGLADLYVIGLYCNVASTTAVANGAQVMHGLTAVIIALSVGSTVCIARSVGAGDVEAQRLSLCNSITLFSGLGVVLAVGMLLVVDPLIGAMDVPVEAVGETADYLTICFAGLPLIVLYNVVAAVYRGLGDTQRPLLFVVIACLINIGLDFLFIGALDFGSVGAAWGTVLAQAVSVVVALLFIWRKTTIGPLGLNCFRLRRRVVGDILRIGTPVALQDGCIQFSFMLIMVIANGRGVVDAAAVGIVEKFIGILFIVPSAMLATTSTIVAQCLGAGLERRGRLTLYRALLISVSFGLLMTATFQVVPEWAVGIFTDDDSVIFKGADYLRGYVLDCVLAGVHFCFSGYFTALGKSYISFAHNIAAIVTARLPLAYLASELYPDTLFPMGIATCTGSLVSVVICLVVYWYLTHNHTQRQRV